MSGPPVSPSQPRPCPCSSQAIASNETAVNLDTADLRAADPQLYEWLVSYPKEVIPAFDQALRQIAVEELGVDYDYIFIVSREEFTAALGVWVFMHTV